MHTTWFDQYWPPSVVSQIANETAVSFHEFNFFVHMPSSMCPCVCKNSCVQHVLVFLAVYLYICTYPMVMVVTLVVSCVAVMMFAELGWFCFIYGMCAAI
jgi:hypothetical protein